MMDIGCFQTVKLISTHKLNQKLNIMFKNFLKITLRNLLKNKVYVSINIVGLGLALACCIVAYLNSQYNWDFDKNHEKIGNIFHVHNFTEQRGEVREFGRVPYPLKDVVDTELPESVKMFRFEAHVFTVRDVNQDKVFHTSVSYADPGFLESYTFPLIDGDLSGYHDIEKTVVTQEYADKFYPDGDAIGKVLTVFDDTGISFNFLIAGVVERAPNNSSVHFEMLIAFENRYRMYDDNVKGNWEQFAFNTFVYLEDPSKVAEIESLLDNYLSIQNQANPDFAIQRFALHPMENHAQVSRNFRWDNLRDGADPAALITPQIMAILILLVACFNFTNTAIATSNRRLKEIGIRKVMGSDRKQLVVQFMTENLAICFLGILMGVAIASWLVPAFSAMWQGMDLEMNFVENLRLFVFLFGLLIFTALLAGLYPSLYISKYEPVSILRGSLSVGGVSRLTKVLLGLQYTFTVIAIFASVAFVQNARYQDTLEMGFNRDQIVGVSVLDESHFQKMWASMAANPDIIQMTRGKHHIGRSNYGMTITDEGMERNVSMLDVGLDYIETMDLKITQGRSYSKELEASDSQGSIIINNKWAEEFGWLDPLGKKVDVNDSTSLTVVGVVENFYLNGFWAPIRPTGIRLSSLRFGTVNPANFLIAKADVSNVRSVFEYLEKEWNSKIPTKTFEGFYQDDFLRQAKEVNDNIMIIFTFLGTIAIVMSCLGLFTLVSLKLIRRTKEIGVRKVLGGSVGHIVAIINKDFLLLLVISSTLGVTLGYLLIDGLIASIFTHYKDMNYVTFSLPAMIIIGLSLTIASLRTLKAALINPVDSLRYE